MPNRLDEIINVDYNKRSINHLYQAARKLYGESLSMRAAEIILDIPENRFVFLSTGSVTRSWVSTSIGETDGPPGTAVLAKMIRLCRTAVPVILTEESLVKPIEAVTRAAGLCVVSPEEARKAQELAHQGYTSVACVLGFPADDQEAVARSKELIKEMDPAALICVEKAGRNEKGIYHSMRGFVYSEGRARIDFLVKEARSAGIPTIGIGDGGNEIGMGAILEAVKEYVPFGAKCNCGCGGGMGCATATDLVVTGAVSNWACYAICCAMAMKTGRSELLPNVDDEYRMLTAGLNAGFVDGNTGRADTTVDTFSLQANCAMIEILRAIALKEIGKK